MAALSSTTRELIAALASRASHCRAVFDAWARLAEGTSVGIRDLTTAARLAASDETGTAAVLAALVAKQLVVGGGGRWKATRSLFDLLPELALAFSAVDHYRNNVHADATSAHVVLTRPAASSELARALDEAGWKTAATEDTATAFSSLVQQAKRRVVVMTPFFDDVGAAWLRTLLAPAPPSIAIALVLRSLEDVSRSDYPHGVEGIRSWLIDRRVDVHNYSIAHAVGAGRETFHAKVVLVDSGLAYVGSANVTSASKERSFELGVVLKGRAAADVATVVDAVLRASRKWTL